MQRKRPGIRSNAIVYISGTAFLIAITIISVYLNITFYNTYGGFYDSVSYLNRLVTLSTIVRDHGFFAATKSASVDSTVFIPWIFGIILSIFHEPMRIFGVFIQVPLLILQFVTAFRFFRQGSNFSSWRSLIYAMPLVAYPAVFHFNGGLNDFRMDLSQAYAYGSFLAILLLARQSGRIWDWVFVGGLVAIASLVRATTPVYVVLLMGLSLLLDLRRFSLTFVLTRYAISGAVFSLCAGWFYIINFDNLYYYYFIWNTDANAHLPLRESLRHLSFVGSAIGVVALRRNGAGAGRRIDCLRSRQIAVVQTSQAMARPGDVPAQS